MSMSTNVSTQSGARTKPRSTERAAQPSHSPLRTHEVALSVLDPLDVSSAEMRSDPPPNMGAQQWSEPLGTTGVNVIRGDATKLIGDAFLRSSFLTGVASSPWNGSGRPGEEPIASRVANIAGLLGLKGLPAGLSPAEIIRFGEEAKLDAFTS